MSSHSIKRAKGRPRGAAARANHDPAAHIASLGLKTEKEYGTWCRKHGFSGAVNKGWRERRQERELARREGQEAEQALASAADLQSHIESLGLATTENYRTWCRDRGLPDSLKKGANRRRKELEFAQAEKATAALTSLRRQTRKPRETIARIFDDENGETLKADYLIRIRSLAHDLECQPQARSRFLELLTSVEKRGDLLRVDAAIPRLGDIESNSFLDGIAALARYDSDWLKASAAWKADSRNPRRQFGSLARHLLARYEVPPFMDSVWFRGADEEARIQQSWFLHLGGGANIRTADLLPLRLTKNMAHHFPQAPDTYTVEEALRYGQIMGQDGDEALVEAVIDTRLGSSFEHEPFWATVIQFLVRHPMLDPDLIGPIVDFIHQQRFELQEQALPGGEIERGGPAQPNFSMKSRSLPKLLSQVEDWHEQLQRDTRVDTGKSWAASGIGEFEWEDKADPDLHWSIREILHGRELVSEGKTMHHCVASYANSCRCGQTSIWSMQVREGTGTPHHVMTIAVQNKSRRISQARGRFNATPKGKNEKAGRLQALHRHFLQCSGQALHLWKEQEGLTQRRQT